MKKGSGWILAGVGLLLVAAGAGAVALNERRKLAAAPSSGPPPRRVPGMEDTPGGGQLPSAELPPLPASFPGIDPSFPSVLPDDEPDIVATEQPPTDPEFSVPDDLVFSQDDEGNITAEPNPDLFS